MKHLVILFLFALVLVSGCTQPPKDCGNDLTCYLDAQEDCERAKYMTDESQEIMNDITVKTQFYAEVRSGTPDNCMVYYRMEKFELEGDLTVMPDEMVEVFEDFDGKSMLCKITGRTEPGLTTFSTVFYDCSGPLKGSYVNMEEYYEELYEVLEQYVSKTFMIPFDSGAYCTTVEGKNTIRISAINTGTEDIAASDFTITVDGVSVPATGGINSGELGFIFDWNCNTGCSSGQHHLTVSTTSVGGKNEVVYCN